MAYQTKYGRKIPWADLMILTEMLPWNPWDLRRLIRRWKSRCLGTQEDVYWGKESTWLDDKRYSGHRDLETR